jgi:2-(3-amino-3-carboxypropyl)histidine synthase
LLIFDIHIHSIRNAITQAKKGKNFGLILGTLGRQGNPLLFTRLKKLLEKNGKKIVQFLMAEIQPRKLLLIKNIDVSSIFLF